MRVAEPGFARWVKDLTTNKITLFHTPDRQQMHLGSNYVVHPKVFDSLVYMLDQLKKSGVNFSVELEPMSESQSNHCAEHQREKFYVLTIVPDSVLEAATPRTSFLAKCEAFLPSSINSIVSGPDLLDIVTRQTP